MPDLEKFLLQGFPTLVRRSLDKLETRVNEAEASADPNAENLRALLTGIRDLDTTVRLELRDTADAETNSRDFFFNQRAGELDVSGRPLTAPIGWITMRRDHLDALMAYGSAKGINRAKTSTGPGRVGRPLTRPIVDAVSGLNKVLKLSLTGFPFEHDDGDEDVEAVVRLGPEATGSEPDVTLTVAYDTLEKLGGRQLTPPQAFMMGLFKIDGDLNIFMQLAALATAG